MAGTSVTTWVRTGAVAAVVALAAGGVPAAHAVGGAVPQGAAASATVKLDIAGPPDAAPGEPRERSCSGALVDPSWVVSAASCVASAPGGPAVEGAPAYVTTAIVGRADLTSTAGHVVDVDQVVPHPERDVVLLHLAAPVVGVAPVVVARAAPAVGDELTITGYGRTAEQIVPDTVHAARYTVGAVGAGVLDIVADEAGAAICKGDAGGPALRTTTGGGLELVGIHHTAYQGGCLGSTSTRRDATETRVDDLAAWIADTVAPPSGADTVGVVRDTTWALNDQNDGGAPEHVLLYGNPGDLRVVGDWDGDGVDTVGVVRGSTWYLNDQNDGGAPEHVFGYGNPGDLPVVGDWDGDGDDTIGVVRGASWYLNDQNDGGAPEHAFGYGNPGDVFVVGDWDGDGADTVGVVRDRTWYLNDQNDGGAPEHGFVYGNPGDVPVVGDWDGDGVDTIGVVRGSSWYLNDQNDGGAPEHGFVYGNPGDVLVVGDWDGS